VYDTGKIFSDVPYDEIFLEILESQLSPEKAASITDIGNSKEKERISIIAEILEKKGGYKEATDMLEKHKMRKLYTRSPFEFALAFCLRYNDTDNNDKYDIDHFIRLLKRLNIGINSAGVARKMPNTLGELRDVILKNTFLNQKNFRETVRYTQNISDLLDDINYRKRKDAEKILKKILEERIVLMCNAQESIRYYLCKYIYHIISNQLIEMQRIVSDLRGKTHSYILSYFNDMRDDVNVFSYQYQITCNQMFDKYVLGDTSLSMTSRQLVLYLTSHTLMLTKLGIRDKTYLLGEELPTEPDHAIFYRNFNDSVLSCFQNYIIDYQKVFSLIFYQSSNNMISSQDTNRYISDKEKKQFIEALLTGEADISRNALIFFLMNARATLGNSSNLINYKGTDKEEFLLFNEDYDELDFSRINYIIRAAGYPPLSIDDNNMDIRQLIKRENISAEDVIERIYGMILSADIEDTDKISDLIEALILYYEDNDTFSYDIVNLKAREFYHRTDELRRTQ